MSLFCHGPGCALKEWSKNKFLISGELFCRETRRKEGAMPKHSD